MTDSILFQYNTTLTAISFCIPLLFVIGMADFTIHTYKSPEEIPPTPLALYQVTNLDFSRYYQLPNGTAKLASFAHLFGGYDAGYYGYAWADAIAADLASRFRASEEGFMDKAIGAQFRKEILEVGGSRDPAESVRIFLGRDWNTDAFFEEMGLDESKVGSGNGGEASGKDGEDVSGQGVGDADETSAAPRAGLFFNYILGVAAISLWWY
jgi:heme/copper-type cytochrome/quinol oxidase subunit 2